MKLLLNPQSPIAVLKLPARVVRVLLVAKVPVYVPAEPEQAAEPAEPPVEAAQEKLEEVPLPKV